MDKLLTLEEVSHLLQVPVATLRYWRNQGTGPASLKVGAHVRYRGADLKTYVDQLAGASPMTAQRQRRASLLATASAYPETIPNAAAAAETTIANRRVPRPSRTKKDEVRHVRAT